MPKRFFFKAEPVDLTVCYQKHVVSHSLQNDPAQLTVIQSLQTVLDHVVCTNTTRRGWFKKDYPGKSLYLYGGVGQGKSMLMDLFYEVCPVSEKRRVHFHAFMQEVHQFIHQWHQKDCVMQAFAKHIQRNIRLLCLDEFHITNIADAVIMQRLFRQLFDQGISIVMTSNRHPSELYQGGILRDQFLPFVKLLLEKATIVQLKGTTDYRQHRKPVYALQAENWTQLHQVFEQLIAHAESVNAVLTHSGRPIQVAAWHDKVLLATFAQLCCATLGVNDFLQIAQRFHYVLLGNIPQLSANQHDAARRFEMLVDVLYENKVILISNSDVPPEAVYTKGKGVFEFQRTVSRLMEMQSQHYVAMCQQYRKTSQATPKCGNI